MDTSQKNPPQPPLALRVKEFCQRMTMSPSTFWKNVRAGEIRVVRIGGSTYVPATEVERLLSGNGEAA